MHLRRRSAHGAKWGRLIGDAILLKRPSLESNIEELCLPKGPGCPLKPIFMHRGRPSLSPFDLYARPVFRRPVQAKEAPLARPSEAGGQFNLPKAVEHLGAVPAGGGAEVQGFGGTKRSSGGLNSICKYRLNMEISETTYSQVCQLATLGKGLYTHETREDRNRPVPFQTKNN